MKQPILAALAVVTKDASVLLARRKAEPDAGLWGFPGGRVEYGEPIGDAACRELLEETSVHANPDRILTGLDTIIRSDAGLIDHHFYLVAVHCCYVSGNPIGRDDVYEASWIPYEDVFEQRISLSDDVDRVLALSLAAEAESDR